MITVVNRTAFVFLIVMGVAIRVSFLFQPMGTNDYDWRYRYHPQAINLMEGRGFSSASAAPYTPDTFDQPGYALFLAGIYSFVGARYWVIGIIQLALELLTLYLVWLAAGAMGLLRYAQIAAVCAGSLCCLLPFVTRFPLTEMLATFSITAALYTTILATTKDRLLLWAASGLSCGLSLLIRPDFLPAIGLMLIAAFGISRNVRGMALATGLLMLALTPWTIRNYVHTGEVLPLGRVFEHSRAPYIKWLDTWVTTRQEEKQYWHLSGPDPAIDYLALANQARAAHPFRVYVITPALRVIRVWSNINLGIPGGRRGMLLMPLNIGVLLAALAGIILAAMKRQRILFLPLALIVGRSILPFISALAVEPRYLYECLPACFLLGGYSIMIFSLNSRKPSA